MLYITLFDVSSIKLKKNPDALLALKLNLESTFWTLASVKYKLLPSSGMIADIPLPILILFINV